jgi:hypothetical protein
MPTTRSSTEVQRVTRVTNQKASGVLLSGQDKEVIRHKRVEDCKKNDILLHCLWCDYVKPIPTYLRPYYKTGDGSNYINYLYQERSSVLANSNAYKKLVMHMKSCGEKHGKTRGDFGPFFDPIHRGKKTKKGIPEVEKNMLLSKVVPQKIHLETPRYLTLKRYHEQLEERKAIPGLVMECAFCDRVKIVPLELGNDVELIELEEDIYNGKQVISNTKMASTAIRGNWRWKEMRQHCLTCKERGDTCLPTFYQESGYEEVLKNQQKNQQRAKKTTSTK